jgi:hypothetical protein
MDRLFYVVSKDRKGHFEPSEAKLGDGSLMTITLQFSLLVMANHTYALTKPNVKLKQHNSVFFRTLQKTRLTRPKSTRRIYTLAFIESLCEIGRVRNDFPEDM